jgi:hypothetical protein
LIEWRKKEAMSQKEIRRQQKEFRREQRELRRARAVAEGEDELITSSDSSDESEASLAESLEHESEAHMLAEAQLQHLMQEADNLTEHMIKIYHSWYRAWR